MKPAKQSKAMHAPYIVERDVRALISRHATDATGDSEVTAAFDAAVTAHENMESARRAYEKAVARLAQVQLKAMATIRMLD